MKAGAKTYELLYRATRYGIDLDFEQMNTLRRASITLSRWAEMECGGGNEYASWGIERDETTGIPYLVTYRHNGTTNRHRTPDREAGALKRISAICQEAGIYFYHQTDPRGAALYIAKEPINSQNYSQFLAIC